MTGALVTDCKTVDFPQLQFINKVVYIPVGAEVVSHGQDCLVVHRDSPVALGQDF